MHSGAVSAVITHPAVRDALGALGIAYEVVACDPALADTAAFCAAYGFDPEDSANCIVVASRRPAGRHLVALVLATTRLDVNGRCCELMGVRRASFAPLEQTAELTGMEIGGVTPFGLPDALQPVRVDAAVLGRDAGRDRRRRPLGEAGRRRGGAGAPAAVRGGRRAGRPGACVGLTARALTAAGRIGASALPPYNRSPCRVSSSSSARCGPDSRRCC